MIEVLAAPLDPALVQKRSEFIYYDAEQPYMQQWHVNFERDLGHQIVAEVGYLGSKGSNLPFYGDPNNVPSHDANGVKQLIAGRDAAVPELGPHPNPHQRRAFELPGVHCERE